MEHKEQLKMHLAKATKLQERARRDLQDNERILTLMELGLKERPLDRDFFEKIKERFEREEYNYQNGAEMLGQMKKMLESIEKEERGEGGED